MELYILLFWVFSVFQCRAEIEQAVDFVPEVKHPMPLPELVSAMGGRGLT